jgi:hypothetical protein
LVSKIERIKWTEGIREKGRPNREEAKGDWKNCTIRNFIRFNLSRMLLERGYQDA